MRNSLYLLLILITTVNYSQKSNIEKDSSNFKSFFEKETSKDTPMSSLAKHMGGTLHNTSNTDFGSSKYDKEINWSVDINENDVQGSLNRFREQRRNEEIKEYGLFTLKILFAILCIIVMLATVFQKRNRFK